MHEALPWNWVPAGQEIPAALHVVVMGMQHVFVLHVEPEQGVVGEAV